ncbi:ZntA Cation transport ATPase [Candidatus Nanopelagicaceae bacterium]
MKARVANSVLLISALTTLMLGFATDYFWIASGLIGLIPATLWFIRDLREKTMGSDVLAVLSLVSTLLTDELFAASVIAVMLASGRVLESWAVGQAERQLKSLLARMPRNVNRVNDDGSLEQIKIEEIAIGDKLLIRSGEITPADGRLTIAATLDESALTGEPLPVQRAINDEISSGVLNAGAPFEFIATTTSANSTYEGIIKLVKSAQAQSAPGVRLANKWAVRFVPIALTVAGLAWLLSGDIDRAVAVLVAATPCPLILAVPIAIVAGLSQSAKNGAVIKGGGILELLSRTETVLLDKTGTLTHGGPAISEVNCAPNFSEDEVIALAASIDQYSPHIVAKSIVEYAKAKKLEMTSATDIEEVPGHQISGAINGRQITVGQLTAARPQWMTLTKPLVVAVSRDGELIGVIGLEDPIRPESQEMIAALRKSGVSHIALVTGDRNETAQDVADTLGITEVFAQSTAADKLKITREAMTNATGAVVVVGDGINDAPALAAAHVGVAMGARGASAASEAADVIIVDDSIDRLIRAIRISKRARRKALQAAGIGMALSFVIMATGALGITSASQGAVAQEAIDVIAILWALTTLKKINF